LYPVKISDFLTKPFFPCTFTQLSEYSNCISIKSNYRCLFFWW